jgi:hypothetical protein
MDSFGWNKRNISELVISLAAATFSNISDNHYLGSMEFLPRTPYVFVMSLSSNLGTVIGSSM